MPHAKKWPKVWPTTSQRNKLKGALTRDGLEGAALFQVVNVVLDAVALSLKVAVHRCGKCGVRQPVGAEGADRHQRSGHLVLALCAALESGDAVRDAPCNGLVVTSLKMQAIYPR
jgi:hypothetical protein